MQRVFSSFKEKLHSLCVNFTDAVDALSGGGFSTMTGEELAQVREGRLGENEIESEKRIN